MGKTDPDFRPNPDRSVCVFGELTDALVSKVAPEILRLRHSGDDLPITVYINSNGGSTRSFDHIHGLLTTKGQSGRSPRIITVAVGNAKSAAANLLSLGSYSLAYPTSSIHFHGVRYSEVEGVTMESARNMATWLHSANRTTAAKLAVSATERLAFHYARLKSKFSKVREKPENSSLSDIECFAFLLREELSFGSEQIVDGAIERWKYLRDLSTEVLTDIRRLNKRGLEFEASVLRGIIDLEIARHKDESWSISGEGLAQIVDDFFLLKDYDRGTHNRLMQKIFMRFSHAFFDTEELEHLEEIFSDTSEQNEAAREEAMETVQNKIKPFCYFCVSVWHGLQEDENPLSPKDSYWLGAIDEIYSSDLPCLRDIAEKDDVEQPDLSSQ